MMKKNLTITLLLFFVLSCTENTTSKNQDIEKTDNSVFFSNKTLEISSITKELFLKYPKTKPNYDTLHKIGKKNKTISLKIKSGQNILVKDEVTNLDDDQQEIHEHLGNIFNYYLIKTSYYESEGFSLFDMDNGFKKYLVSEPYISPNRKYVFSHCSSLDYSEMPTEFQIWEVNSEKLKKKILINADKENLNWGINEIRFIDDNNLVIEIIDSKNRLSYGLLKIK